MPKELNKLIQGYSWKKVTTGCSDAEVYCLKKNDRRCYLKVAPKHALLYQEKQKLDWLIDVISVPEVIIFCTDDTHDYLLLSEIPGLPAHAVQSNYQEVVTALALGLRQWHNLSTKDCPFDMRLSVKVELARQRVETGVVDEKDFDRIRRGKKASELFYQLLHDRVYVAEEDLVMVHGDYCLPNIIMKNVQVNGYIDVSSAGIGDRYQDLALAARSLSDNFGQRYVEQFFAVYDISKDDKKVEYYQLLDEFF